MAQDFPLGVGHAPNGRDVIAAAGKEFAHDHAQVSVVVHHQHPRKPPLERIFARILGSRSAGKGSCPRFEWERHLLLATEIVVVVVWKA
jgi:hypothetical protein